MMVRTEPGRIGSANWSADGQTLYFNRDGQMEKMAVLGGKAESFSVGSGLWCDDNHGLSPDNRFFAASCGAAKGQPSSIYVLALAGGAARRITRDGAAEFHGWSPDGTTVAFTQSKDGRSDVYTVPAQGGKPVRLTTSGYNDGPEFGPDGNIYFNSDRSGSMQIWCMGSNGARPEQISSDDAEDWFPHVSPDGKQMVYLSYAKGTQGHPANQAVKLRLEELSSRQSRVLVDLLGGQSTLNAPSWSPDNHHLAFTGFERLPADADGPEFVMVAPKPDVPAK
jgi:TolB protein